MREQWGFNGSISHQRTRETFFNHESGEIICYYYHEPGHSKKMCPKLQNKNWCSQMVHMVVKAPPLTSYSNKSILIFIDEHEHFS